MYTCASQRARIMYTRRLAGVGLMSAFTPPTPENRPWIIGQPIRNWFKNHYEDSGRWNAHDPEHSCCIIADPRKLDLHLSYSKGFEKGPIIQRTGDCPPVM